MTSKHRSAAHAVASACKPRKPGTKLHKVASRLADGRTRDQLEAARTFAHEPWAASARYLGWSGGYFLWERAS